MIPLERKNMRQLILTLAFAGLAFGQTKALSHAIHAVDGPGHLAGERRPFEMRHPRDRPKRQHETVGHGGDEERLW